MTSRERVRAVLHHQIPDRIPLDLGGTMATGISASTYAKLRSALGFPQQPVRIAEPLQLLGGIDPEVGEFLGVDVIGIDPPMTIFGFRNEGWKPWRLPDWTEVLVPEQFVTTTDPNGDTFIYPQGDLSVAPSGHLPKDGYYFDVIVRQEPIDEANLSPEDWIDGQVSVLTDDDLAFLQRQVDSLYAETDKALTYWWNGGGLGDVAVVPGPWQKHPKGIRDLQLWYMAPLLYPDYLHAIFALQTDIGMKNLELMHQAMGDKLDVICLSGTDFGMQSGPMINPATYREFFKPHHERMIAWIHQHTGWQVMFHCCGAITEFLDDFVEIGVDVLNPVQCSAAGMDPRVLKARWGDKLVFWGGAVDTQRVLPFGTPDEVRAHTREQLSILGKNGGLVACAIHNIQSRVPVENVLAFVDTVRNFAPY